VWITNDSGLTSGLPVIEWGQACEIKMRLSACAFTFAKSRKSSFSMSLCVHFDLRSVLPLDSMAHTIHIILLNSPLDGFKADIEQCRRDETSMTSATLRLDVRCITTCRRDLQLIVRVYAPARLHFHGRKTESRGCTVYTCSRNEMDLRGWAPKSRGCTVCGAKRWMARGQWCYHFHFIIGHMQILAARESNNVDMSHLDPRLPASPCSPRSIHGEHYQTHSKSKYLPYADPCDEE
jgi:hypothetical protein